MSELASSPGRVSASAHTQARPRKPRPGLFGVGVGVGVVVLTLVTVWDWEYGVGFSIRDIFEKFSNSNPVISASSSPNARGASSWRR